jgi:hypothetical protein
MHSTNNKRKGLICEAKISHIRLLTEEAAKILGKDILDAPKVKLIIEVEKITIMTSVVLIFMCIRIIKGIHFWIVDNIKSVFKDTDDKILTNQPWNGGTPNFKKMGKVFRSENSGKDLFSKKREPVRKIIEPMLWIRKYLKVLSINASILSENIMGKKLSILSSRASHKHSEELLLRARKILTIKDMKNPIIGENIIYLMVISILRDTDLIL